MSFAAIIRDMASAGATPEAIAIAIEAIEAVESRLVDRRASDRDRTREYRKRRNLTDREWASLTAMVTERDGWVCTYCDCDTSLEQNGFAIDHVLPLARGGNNDIDNLTMACRACNSSKSDSILGDEWTPPNCDFARWQEGAQ